MSTFIASVLPAHSAGFAAGDYITPIGVINTITARTPSVSASVVAWPFYFPARINIAKIGVTLTTGQAGAECMVGLYDNANGRPANLIVDGGPIDLSGAPGNKFATVSVAVIAWIWALVWLKNVATQCTLAGPTTDIGGLMGNPVAVLSGGGPRGHMDLTAAYPAVMPAVAPAVAPSSSMVFGLALLQAA